MSPEQKAALSLKMKERHAALKAEKAAAAENPPVPTGNPPVDDSAFWGGTTPQVIPDAGTPVITPTGTPPTLDPHQAFCAWMQSPEGMDATDPRLPTDFGRVCARLEDNARAAFQAGWKRGEG